MLKRKIEAELEAFYVSDERTALLLTGARQVGKTESVLCFPAQAVSFGRGFLGGGVIV